MTMRAGVVLGVVLVFGIAGCGGSTPSASPPTSSPPTAVVSSTPSPSAPPSAAVTDANAVAIGSVMSVDVPSGWLVTRGQVYFAAPLGDSVCLYPRGANQSVFGCAGIEIDFGKHLPGAHTDAYAPNKPDGWYPALDVQPCPFGPSKVNGQMNGIETKPGLSKGLRPVGAHKADWNQWTASCTSGQTFHPAAWYLPKSHVVIFDYTGHAETAAVLASARFAADGDALPAMATYLTGHLISLNGSTLTVQPFHTYSTNPADPSYAAGKQYAKTHHIRFPFFNDYLDADFGPTKTITIGTDTACIGGVDMGQTIEGDPVRCSAFAGALKYMPLAIWVRGGRTESVAEIFRP